MKVLQVNCVYRKGSTGKVTADIHAELLRQGVESMVCYGRGARIDEPFVYRTCGELYAKVNKLAASFTGLMYGGCRISTRKLISIIEREQPDIVHLQCINGNFVNIYKLIQWLKEHRIKTVLTLHAEFMHTANCGHALDCDRWQTGCGNCPSLRTEIGSLLRDGTADSWRRMKAAFEGFEQDCIAVSVSPWLMLRAKQSPILGQLPHTSVLNGVNTAVFHPYDTTDLRRKHGLTDEKIVFHATAYFSADPMHIKGSTHVLALAERLKGENIRFFVAGNYDETISVPENVTLLGRVTNQQELARYYAMADVTLLTSKKETFSMIVAESLCCGTPVVGMNAGGPEAIALRAYSSFVPQGDLDALEQQVHRWLAEQPNPPAVAAEAYAAYSAETMCRAYLQLYRNTLHQDENRKDPQ